jgi:tRNA-uridine 2-sulfurtransferase
MTAWRNFWAFNMVKKVKALILFSGGLDSQLAIKILQEQKIDIIALHFILPFGAGCCTDQKCVFNFTQVTGVKLELIDCTYGQNLQEYLAMIKNPEFGHGTGTNPCIDCRIFILKKAKELMENFEADFIVTGEVLGERPMSQHLQALKLIEKETGLENKILRPLSAKLLPETEAEIKGLVDREKLCTISGRRRIPQIELAKKYGLKNYPQPAGGCLLCDKEFSKRFLAAVENFSALNENDIELMKVGRQSWQDKTLIAIGRNQQENEKLEKLRRENDVLVEPENFPGPTALIRGKKITLEIIENVKKTIIRYSTKAKSLKDFIFTIKRIEDL